MKKKEITLNNNTFSYFDEGKGKIILLIHGWCDQSDGYVKLISQLKKHFRVIAPDLPNFGDSGNQKFEFKTYTDFLREFISKLKIRDPLIIGHSFGGRLALQYAKQHKISDLILINPAGLNIHKKKFFFALLVVYISVYELINDFIPMTRILSCWLKNIFRYFIRTDFWKLFSQILFSDEENLSEIKSRITILWADNDMVFSGDYPEKLREKLKGSDLIYMKGSHFACIIKPEQISDEIIKLYA